MDEKTKTQIENIFKHYKPFFYRSPVGCIVVTDMSFPYILKSYKRLKMDQTDIDYVIESYISFKKRISNIFRLIVKNISNYPEKIKETIGRYLYNAKNIHLYTLGPVIPPPLLKKVSNVLDKYEQQKKKLGLNRQFKLIVDTTMRFFSWISTQKDPLLYSGVLTWVNGILNMIDEPLSSKISTYLNEYMESISQSMNQARNTITTDIDSKIPDKKVIIINQNRLLYKGVKKNKKNRLIDREQTYYTTFNPVLAFPYAYNREKEQYITTEKTRTLDDYCGYGSGYIGVFVPKRKLRVLLLNNMENVNKIKSYMEAKGEEYLSNKFTNTLDSSVIKAVNIALPTRHKKSNTLDRISEYESDVLLSKVICDMGYDGYIGKRFRSLSPELMVCTRDYLKLVDIVNTRDLIYYCRGTIYDTRTIFCDDISSDRKIHHVNPSTVGNKYLSKWSDKEIDLFIRNNNMINWRDRNRNILEIYLQSDILNLFDISDLLKLAKKLNINIRSFFQRKNKKYVIGKIKTALRVDYLRYTA